MKFTFNPITRSLDLVGSTTEESKQVTGILERLSALEADRHTHPQQVSEPSDNNKNSIWVQPAPQE